MRHISGPSFMLQWNLCLKPPAKFFCATSTGSSAQTSPAVGWCLGQPSIAQLAIAELGLMTRNRCTTLARMDFFMPMNTPVTQVGKDHPSSSCSEACAFVMSCMLTSLVVIVCCSPECASTQICSFIQKCHYMPFLF